MAMENMLFVSIIMDAFFFYSLFWAALTDIKKREIPNVTAIIIAALGAVAAVLSESVIEHLLGLAIAVPLVIPGLLGHMGGGDYKLLLGTGLYLGLTKSLLAVVLSVPATICVVVYLLAKKKTLKNVRIPLAPLIAFGCMGSVIIKWGLLVCN